MPQPASEPSSPRPAGGRSLVKAAPSRSYAGELHSLWESVADPATATDAAALSNKMRQELLEAFATCESP